MEVDSIRTINALCLRFSTKAKPYVREDHNKYMSLGEFFES